MSTTKLIVNPYCEEDGCGGWMNTDGAWGYRCKVCGHCVPWLPATVRETTPHASEDLRDKALARFQRLAREKYNKGRAEHGDGLLGMSTPELLEEIESEIMDLWFYVGALRRREAIRLSEDVCEGRR